MTSSPDAQQVMHERLGALVRQQRERQGLSMDEVAARARVSRSSIHRLEHGAKFKPTPSKLARVLQVVGLGPDEIEATLPDDEYRGDVLVWLSRSDMGAELDETLERARPAAQATPDLVALHPDGTVARIQVQGDSDEALAGALRRAGWLVTRPD